MTQAQQPEALRLADELDEVHQGYADEGPSTFSEAAAELRRLHHENTALQQVLVAARLKIDHLRSVTKVVAPSGEYPPLPGASLWRDETGIRGYGTDPGTGPWYTADQLRAYADTTCAMRAQGAPVAQGGPIGYLAAYEVDRLKQGHDGHLRSPKFGPSPLDSDVPVYLGPLPTAGVLALVQKWRHAAEHLGLDGLASLADCADELEATLRASHGQAPAPTTQAAPQPAAQQGGTETFQQRVQPWMLECFGAEISADRVERNHRFLEEALELVQSTGCSASEAHQLVDYVYGRPVGEPAQEVGGVMVTLAALCLANDLDMHVAADVELARIWTKVETIRAKQAAKPKHSPMPAAPVAQGDALTDTYVQQVPDKCDRIVWRGRYYHLPIDAAEHSYTEPSPMAKVAAALRQKAEQEDAAYQARRSDQGLMESEWGPMEDAPPHEDPPMHVAVVEGDDTVRTLQWNRDVAAFAYPAGTLLYAARSQAKKGGV